MLRNGCTIPVEVIYPGVHCSILSLLYPMTPHYSPSSVRTAYHYVLRLDPAYEGKQPWSIPYWVKGNVLVDLIHTKQCFYRGKERSFHVAIICDETQCIGEYLQSKAKNRTSVPEEWKILEENTFQLAIILFVPSSIAAEWIPTNVLDLIDSPRMGLGIWRIVESSFWRNMGEEGYDVNQDQVSGRSWLY